MLYVAVGGRQEGSDISNENNEVRRIRATKHHILQVFFLFVFFQRLKTLIELIGLPDKYKIRFNDLALDEFFIVWHLIDSENRSLN